MTYAIAIAVLLGLVPAVIARRKDRSFVGYWVFGTLALIVALPVALLVSDRRPYCTRCAEPVRWEALACPHCGAEFDEEG